MDGKTYHAGTYYKLLDIQDPIHKNLKEVILGGYKIYLNHGDETIALTGYNLLQETEFQQIPPYGILLVKL